MTWNLDDERRLLATAGQESFETFARVVLGFTHKDNPKGRWWSDEVHKPLCAWFQAQALDWLANRSTRTERTYLGILIPRACAKSLLITRAGMLWLHLQDPDLSTYIGNEKLDLAEEFLGTIKGWLEGSNEDPHCIFNWLYGTWRTEDKRWRSDSIVHGARKRERSEPSFGIWSPNSALTGRHPDIVCMDDLVSYDALKKDLNWFEFAYSHMTDLIPVVENNGLVILVGTRYSDADPFGRAFKTHGIKTIAGHTDFDEYKPRQHGRWNVYFLSGRTPTGEPAIPSVWSEGEMLHYEATDPIKYAAQIRNRPKAHKLRALTEEQFDACIVDALPTKRSMVVINLDTAFKNQRKVAAGSENALLVVAHHEDTPGHITVLDCFTSINHRADTFARLILDAYTAWRPRYRIDGITDESEMAGKLGLWEQYLSDYFATNGEPHFPAFYSFQRQSGDRKEVRISNAINFILNGQVRFHRDATCLAELRDQLCNHPNAHPNDLADAFADNFSPEFFTGVIPAILAHREEYPLGSHEQNTKSRFYATMEQDEEEEARPPIRREQPWPDASTGQAPISEWGVALPPFIIR